jgi:transglutaminase-like putative cysteine protease
VTELLRSRVLGLTVLVVALAVAVASPAPVAVFAIALGTLSLLIGPRLEIDRVAQAALTVSAMTIGVLVPRFAMSGPAHESATRLSERAILLVLPMLAVAAARAIVKRPVYGVKVTLAAALVALTGAGHALTGASYPVLAALALVLGFVALRVGDPARAPVRRLGPRYAVAALLIGAVAASCAFGLALSLPRLHDAVMARVMARWDRQRTGFSDDMWLGSMSGMLQDDRIVMRVRGDAPALLRGVVFVRYTTGRWETIGDVPTPEVVETAAEPPVPAGLVEIEHAGVPKRYFVPLGVNRVVASAGIYERDAFQVFRAPPAFPSKRVWFAPALESRSEAPLAPRLEDMHVPTRASPELAAILDRWGVSHALSPRQRVGAIADRLQEYDYALEFERSPGKDPVLDFLTTHREGHCEYFASAMVLLARSARVPARVVAGYRVVERSPFGYAVVREKHAHSWAEVWIDGAWETIDPTPPADLVDAGATTTPTLPAILDALRTAWEAFDDWIARRTPFELSGMLVGLVGVLIIYRAVRARRAGRLGAAGAADPPLEAFVTLARALAERGLERPPHQTLHRFASRVADSSTLPEAAREAVRRALDAYEQHRYASRAGRDEVETLLRQAESAVRQA